jgi:uncharacterized protein YdgA (DUF945 family)
MRASRRHDARPENPMNKPALAATGAALVILLASPWVVGALAEQRITADVARLDTEGQLDASMIEYSRGWATSAAIVELRLPGGALDPAALPPDAPADLVTAAEWLAGPIRLLVSISHGPVLLGNGLQLGVARSTVRLDPATPGYQALIDELGIPYLFELRTTTGFDAQSGFVNELPAFTLERPDLTMSFSGSTTTGSYDAAARRLVGQGDIAALHMNGADGSFDVERAAFSFDSTRYNEVLRLGYGESTIGRISVDAPGGGFAADDLQLRGDLTLDDDGEHATLTMSYGVARISDAAELDVSDVAMTATFRQIDVDALSAYYAGVQNAGLQDDASAPLSLAVEDAVYDLLAASPRLEFAPIQLNWSGEPFSAKLSINVDGASLPPRSNFTALMLATQGVLNADASIELTEPLAYAIASRGIEFQLRRANAQDSVFMADDEIAAVAQSQAVIALAALAAQGMLTRTSGGYTTTAQFNQGRLTINGNPIPFGLQ